MSEQFRGWVIVEIAALDGGVASFAASRVIDARTGVSLVTVTKMSIIASSDRPEFIAELEMLADGDGEPLIGDDPHQALVECYKQDGSLRVGTFRWHVAEIRVVS